MSSTDRVWILLINTIELEVDVNKFFTLYAALFKQTFAGLIIIY
jgi:hypothetical protein